MIINIQNCNNVDQGAIELKEGLLNIKYAINGTGKSTIAKAIAAGISDKKNGSKELLKLKPFKYLDDETKAPSISGIDSLASIKTFDESYISEFVFQADDLLKGSFDIFIRNDKYEDGMKDIEARAEIIKKMLAADQDITTLIADFNELSLGFGKPTKTGIHGSSNVAKAFKEGNKVQHIPHGLEAYKSYIQHPENYKWIQWQIDGKNYIDVSTDCPYCTTDIQDKKETIKKISEVYEPKSIQTLNKLVSVFQRLDKYFSDETKNQINQFVTNVDGYSDDQVEYLREVNNQILLLHAKFVKAQQLGFLSLKDVDKVIDELKEYKINLGLYHHLNSVSTKEKSEIVNQAIDEVLKEAGELQGCVNRQKALIEKLVKDNCKQINDFLRNAGYKYNVHLLEDKQGTHRLKLIHLDAGADVGEVKNHLSFGERNAFALVLFMFDSLKTSPDLVILDDPISSFDKNKKYAIMEMLFRGEHSFKGKTVLLLTHDFDPIVDMVLHHSDRFVKPYATFIENAKANLSEKEVTKSDIKSFIEINLENLELQIHDLNKLVYLRRYYEVTKNKHLEFDVLSNLFHKRTEPTLNDNGTIRAMTAEEITAGVEAIKAKVPNFDYSGLLALALDDLAMKSLYETTTNNYEKLHIYRLIFEDKESDIDSVVIQKFINEAFHIENNYIYQLNPTKYPVVPQYVIDECDKFVQALEVPLLPVAA